MIANALVLGVISLIIYFTWPSIQYADLKDLIDILKNASAMIFTIVGIWLAYIYPNAVTALVNPESISMIAGKRDARRIEMLVSIIITSALVIIGIVVFFSLKVLIGSTAFYYANIEWIKPSAMILVFFLTYLQVLSVARVVLSNVLFLNDLHRRMNEQLLEGEE